MKFLKNIMTAALTVSMAFFLSSCNEDAKVGDASIGFAKDSYVFKESAGIVKIPLEITGEVGSEPIVFSVQAKSNDPKISLDTLVLFTQTENLKYTGKTETPVNVEFQIYDNKYINDSRYMTLTLTNVSGAKTACTETVVELSDNDNNPYERLWGTWTFTGLDFKGNEESFEVSISGGFTDEEVEANADKVLVCWGFAGEKEDVTSYNIKPGYQPVWYMDYDAASKSLSVAVGTMMANIWKFNLPNSSYSSFELYTASLSDVDDEAADFDTKTAIPASFSDDCKTITFTNPKTGFAALIYGDGEYTEYYWAGYYNVKLVKK